MRKLKIASSIVLLMVLTTAAIVASTPIEQVPVHPFFSTSNPLVIAHRGGRGLWPESTIFAFQRALDLGVDVLEMDVHVSADGEVVVIHDPEVGRTTQGKGLVHELSLQQIQELDAGYNWTNDGRASFPFRGKGIRIPSLGQVFQSLPEAMFNIEIKPATDEAASSLCRIIREYGRENDVLVASFRQTVINTFRTACPEVATVAPMNETRLFYFLNVFRMSSLYEPRGQAFQVPENLGRLEIVTPHFVEKSHQHGVEVHVWTINEREKMQRLIELGVDGIMTDYPDRLLRLLGRL